MLTIVRVRRNGWQLEAWESGATEPVVFDPPCQPFFYTPLLELSSDRFKVEIVKRRLLSKPTEWTHLSKILCKTVYDVPRVSRYIGHAFENQVRFVERLSQDYGFVQRDQDCSVMAFDVEASSTGQFPTPKNDKVITMAVYSRNRQESFIGDEESIFEAFVDVVSGGNSDLFATYAGTAFDYDFPLERCHRLGRELPIGKLGDESYTKTIEYGSGRFVGQRKDTFLHGRICFDVFHEVLLDTNLSGIRRGLKDVGKFYFPDDRDLIVELDRQRLKQASKSELADYCLSDARLAYKLAEMYLDMLKPIAVELKVPLDIIVNRRPSHIGNLIYGREFNELGIVSDGTNLERFRGILW